MVLQRDRPVRIFGWASPGTEVQVRIGTTEAAVLSRADGQWIASLPPFSAGGPHTLSVTSAGEIAVFQNILFGDVWLCSGQSNMNFRVSRSVTAKASIKKARLPLIRHFEVERIASEKPLDDVTGSWSICDPATVAEFTAVGFYFAREVFQQTGIPIGLIHSSWGGTPIEAWIPPETYKSSPALRPLLRMQKELQEPSGVLEELFRKWERENVSIDPGNTGEAKGWARPDYDDSEWKTMQVPGFWEGRGLFIDGAVWFRLGVKIPKAWQGRELQLELGPIDDFDETYFNGNLVGKIGKSVMNAHRVPRIYSVPATMVRSGTATLAVRIFDHFGSGGFVGQKETMRLTCPALPDSKALSLAGNWRYFVEWAVERPSPVPQPPMMPEPRGQLSWLYNGMIHALTRFPLRGILWYQGESNAFRASHYRQSFPLLIQAWRKAWGDDELPFYFVQLANFKSCPNTPSDDYWAELREAQVQALRLKETGMAAAIDLGEEEDIHPRNKEAVGKRLACLALARTYGKPVADSGPVLSQFTFGDKQARLIFRETGAGLRTSDGLALRSFAVAGSDKKWRWARAQVVSGKAVVLTWPKGPKPVAIRYGWASNPGSNLVNTDGFPATPFRTDDWPLISEGNLWPF